jgi:hypothetical protein
MPTNLFLIEGVARPATNGGVLPVRRGRPDEVSGGGVKVRAGP